MNKSYYSLLARILLYKFNKFHFQGVQKTFKKRFMRPAFRRANMKEFWSLHQELKSKSNQYLRSTGFRLLTKPKHYYDE